MVNDLYKKMAMAVIRQYNLSDADDWDSLPDNLKAFFSDNLPYNVVVAPILRKMKSEGASIKQMCIRTGLSVTQVRYILDSAYFKSYVLRYRKKRN